MGNTAEKEIIGVLDEYALSLNSARYDSIAEFYTEDGILMPQGYKTFSKADFLKNRSGDFLERTDFRIEYTIEDTVLDENYAFVTAIAKTSSKNFSTGDISKKTSRDFFVLRKGDENWKIYRYMFNTLSLEC